MSRRPCTSRNGRMQNESVPVKYFLHSLLTGGVGVEKGDEKPQNSVRKMEDFSSIWSTTD